MEDARECDASLTLLTGAVGVHLSPGLSCVIMADFGMEGSTYGGYGSRDYTKAVLQYAGRDYTKGKELSQLSGKGAGAADQQGRMAWDGRPYDLVDWEAEERRGCCARTWRAKWNLKPRGPRWLPEIIRMTWYLQIINLVFSIQGGVDGDLGANTPFSFRAFLLKRTRSVTKPRSGRARRKVQHAELAAFRFRRRAVLLLQDELLRPLRYAEGAARRIRRPLSRHDEEVPPQRQHDQGV